MENNNSKQQSSFISEEEKTLNWETVQNSFEKTFGSEVYNSWLQKISLVKEYNDYLILGVPTRCPSPPPWEGPVPGRAPVAAAPG